MKKEDLIKLLMGMGISKANAELIADESTDPTKINEATILEEFKAHQLTLHENEPSIIKKIESSTVGRERDKVERKIKQLFALSADETKDKTTEEIIAIAKAKMSTNNDKTLEQLQQEIVDKANEIKNLKEVEIPGIRSEVDKSKKTFLINEKLTKKVSAFKLRNPLEDVMAAVNNLNNIYDIDLDDKGELVYKVKGSELSPKNAEGTKILTADDIIKTKLEAGKFLAESNADEEDENKRKEIIVSGGKKTDIDTAKLPGYEAAQARLEEMKSKSAAK